MTDPKVFPLQDYRPIPWELIAPHEAQAVKNHGGQTLQRLAERGGLSPCEALCAIRGEGIGRLLREPHGLRRDKQTGETICRCTCAHDLEDLAEKHRRESSAPSELERLREALRIAEQERDGLREELTQCRWDARHVAGCADTKTWEANNFVDYVQKRFRAELETLRLAETTRNAAQDIATRETLRRREVEEQLEQARADAAEQRRARLLAECERAFERVTVAELRLELHRLRGTP